MKADLNPVRRFAAFAAITGFAVLALDGRTAENATAGAPGLSGSEAISAARREIDALKAAQQGIPAQNGELPKLDMPQLQTAAPTMPKVGGSAAKNAPKGEPKSSSNWLVDAMNKEPRTTQSRSRRGAASDLEKSNWRLGDARDNSFESESDGVRGHERESFDAMDAERNTTDRKDGPVLENPLTRYLGDWMTPQDYALLRPGLETSSGRISNGAVAANHAAIGSPGGSERIGFDGKSFGLGSDSIQALQTKDPPKENPFLASLDPVAVDPLPAASLPAPAPRARAPMIAIPPERMTPAGAIAPARPKFPDFAKPSQDEKYFKQLKRF